MTRLDWAKVPREYEVGVDRGALYFGLDECVAWNGLLRISEKVDGATAKPLYFEGVVYNLQQNSAEFSAEVEAYVYPYLLEEHVLALCDTRVNVGAGKDIDIFNFTYRVTHGAGYKIHLVYNIIASFEGYTYNSISSSSRVEPFSLTFHATPEKVPNAKPTAHFIVDTTKADPDAVEAFEDFLYGSEFSTPRFPPVEKLMSLFAVTEV